MSGPDRRGPSGRGGGVGVVGTGEGRQEGVRLLPQGTTPPADFWRGEPMKRPVIIKNLKSKNCFEYISGTQNYLLAVH